MANSTRLEMPADLQAALEPDAFHSAMALQGEVFRDVRGRRTIRTHLLGQPYFIKQHFGVGWKEIFKNLLSLRLPILGAATEWRAIHALNRIGIPTTPAVAFGQQGLNPASQQSFIITRDLGDIVSLETLCATWPHHPPDFRLKRLVLLEVARLARLLHDNGLNHRDFYICHFCLDQARLQQGEFLLYLIDLHRVGIRRRLPSGLRMKDVAALYFSSLELGFTWRDYLRFIRAYKGSLQTLRREKEFWLEVDERARRLFHKMHRRWPVTPFDAGAAA